MFNRTIKMLTAGVRPCYVFDGKPPQMKGGELEKRLAKRNKAEVDLAAAKEAGDNEDVDKFSRRLVKVSRQHNEDCKTLLRLMGVPVIDAPCEAEAQCAELAKKGKVYATATEDMDALTFRTPKLLRKLTFSSGKDIKILEIDTETVLTGLGLSYEQFVDLCILCGCDYCNTIKGKHMQPTSRGMTRRDRMCNFSHHSRTFLMLYPICSYVFYIRHWPKDSTETDSTI
jgi:flap endonuclease-1